MKESTAVIDYPNFAEQSRKTGFRKETKIIFREEDETTVLQTLQDFGGISVFFFGLDINLFLAKP